MAHKYPPWPTPTSAVVSTEDLNENMTAFADETGGSLDEHNFKNSFIDDRTRLVGGVAMRLVKDQRGFGCSPGGAPTPAGRFNIPRTNSWETITGTSVTVNSPGCTLWVIASWQHAIDGPGTLYAIQVEGQTVPETILGGVEGDNEMLTRGGLATSDGNSDSTYAPTRRRMPMATQLLIPLSMGEYTVGLVARVLDGEWHTTVGVGVDSRELITIQLFR